jgi:leucyl aminopeptidase
MTEGDAGSRIDVIPSLGRLAGLSVAATSEVQPGAAEAVASFVPTDGPVPAELGVDRATLAACGFDGRAGQSLVVAGSDQMVRVAVGVGGSGTVTANDLRDAAARFSRSLPHLSRFALQVPSFAAVPVAAAAKAVVEGAVLGRYHFHIRRQDDTVELAELSLVVGADSTADAEAGARRGRVVAEAT